MEGSMTESPLAPPPAAEPLPWEDPHRQGFAALLHTVQLVLLRPREAFRRMNRGTPASRALLFALVVAWPSMTLGALLALLLDMGELAAFVTSFKQSFGRHFPEPLSLGVPMLLIFSGLAVLLPPIFLVIFLAVHSLVLHLFLLLFAGRTKSLGTTFRVLAYSQATAIFYLMPVAGSLLAFLWQLLVTIPGLAAAHGTSETRAAWAVLTPLLLACACLTLLFAFITGSAVVKALGSL